MGCRFPGIRNHRDVRVLEGITRNSTCLVQNRNNCPNRRCRGMFFRFCIVYEAKKKVLHKPFFVFPVQRAVYSAHPVQNAKNLPRSIAKCLFWPFCTAHPRKLWLRSPGSALSSRRPSLRIASNKKLRRGTVRSEKRNAPRFGRHSCRSNGAPRGIRTPNPGIMSPLLHH